MQNELKVFMPANYLAPRKKQNGMFYCGGSHPCLPWSRASCPADKNSSQLQPGKIFMLYESWTLLPGGRMPPSTSGKDA
jgi:hypothetical protein